MVRLFPSSTDKRGEATAGGRVFCANTIGRVAINVGGAHLHPDWRRRIDRSQGAAQDSGCFDARTKNLVLMIWSFDAVDATPNEVHESGRPFEFALPGSK